MPDSDRSKVSDKPATLGNMDVIHLVSFNKKAIQ